MTSYRRNCKYCGRSISMRQMPGGHWVAFEDNVAHDCGKTPVKKDNSKTVNIQRGADDKSIYDDIELVNVDIGKGTATEREMPVDQVKPIAEAKNERQTSIPQRPVQHNKYRSSDKSDDWSWIIWIIIFIFLIYMCSK